MSDLVLGKSIEIMLQYISDTQGMDHGWSKIPPWHGRLNNKFQDWT
jgi:hypothetical protein